jgi:hypothetical protein
MTIINDNIKMGSEIVTQSVPIGIPTIWQNILIRYNILVVRKVWVICIYTWWFSCRSTVTRRVLLVEQELLTHPEHPSLPSSFSGIRVCLRKVVSNAYFGDPSVFFNVYLQNTAQFADDLLHFEYIRFNKYFLEKRLKTPNGVIRSRKSKQDSQCNDVHVVQQ